jgi:Rrf2 family protein
VVKINKKVEYSLIVLKHLNTDIHNNQVTAREICDIYNTPFDTTSRVMQTMNKNRILESTQGQKGGYKLAINLDEISYLELTEYIEGKKAGQDCTESNCALLHSCNITGPIKKLNQYLLQFFQGLTIKELLEESQLPQSLLTGIKGN